MSHDIRHMTGYNNRNRQLFSIELELRSLVGKSCTLWSHPSRRQSCNQTVDVCVAVLD